MQCVQRRVAASQLLDGHTPTESLKGDSFIAFGLAIVLFSLGSTLFFTPMPIFFTQGLGLSVETVFIICMLNSTGAMVGYFLTRRITRDTDAKKQLRRIVLTRSLLVFSTVVIVQFTFLHGVANSRDSNIFQFGIRDLSCPCSFALDGKMPAGRPGLFDVFVGLGTASGSFLGPFIAQTTGFVLQFLIAGIFF
jgi:hypothetical protein